MNNEYPHYVKDVSHIEKLDVYRVLELFGIESHAIGHAIKKLLVAGQRGAKDAETDVVEARDSLTRWLEMREEDREREPDPVEARILTRAEMQAFMNRFLYD